MTHIPCLQGRGSSRIFNRSVQGATHIIDKMLAGVGVGEWDDGLGVQPPDPPTCEETHPLLDRNDKKQSQKEQVQIT